MSSKISLQLLLYHYNLPGALSMLLYSPTGKKVHMHTDFLRWTCSRFYKSFAFEE